MLSKMNIVTPRKTNYADQLNENHPIIQSEFKGIVSKITKISSSRIAKNTFANKR